MLKQIQISIPTPCHEKWSEMTANEQGAFCKVCQKNVIDFTNKTENEIYETLTKVRGASFGRFRLYQLEQPITKSEIKTSWFNWKATAAAVMAFITTQQVSADKGDKVKIELQPVSRKLPVDTSQTITTLPKKDTTQITPEFSVIAGGISIQPIDRKTHKTGKLIAKPK